MNKTAIAIIASVLLIIVTLFGSFVTYANYGNRAEVSIVKEYENLQNILSQYNLKVQEAAQVPTMYKDDMKEVMTSVMTARQGPGGSKAAFAFFKEHDIKIDAGMYKKIQQLIESGRNEFKNAQTRFLDVKSVYVVNLGNFWSGMWLGIVGRPKLKVGYPHGTQDDFTIVKSATAVETFKTGIDSGMKLR